MSAGRLNTIADEVNDIEKLKAKCLKEMEESASKGLYSHRFYMDDNIIQRLGNKFLDLGFKIDRLDSSSTSTSSSLIVKWEHNT